ncbi:MAG: zinc ribbon domain-containing protein [Planctomycetota bacterium]|nr:zinc ribbon domain-containing protein [Planctomycetaceae bacterium]MDQ3330325.1 zinc ribbon domain-containing protein [Planctomycetota bacterium]
MPLYEFRCPTCSREFEALVRPTEQAICPSCRSPKVERLLSVTSARVTGTGPAACPPVEAGPCGPGCCRLPN